MGVRTITFASPSLSMYKNTVNTVCLRRGYTEIELFKTGIDSIMIVRRHREAVDVCHVKTSLVTNEEVYADAVSIAATTMDFLGKNYTKPLNLLETYDSLASLFHQSEEISGTSG